MGILIIHDFQMLSLMEAMTSDRDLCRFFRACEGTSSEVKP